VKTIWDHSQDGELTFLAEYADDSEKSWPRWFYFLSAMMAPAVEARGLEEEATGRLLAGRDEHGVIRWPRKMWIAFETT